MKNVKILGLAVMATIALMAFGGSSASAANLYSTGVKIATGSQLHASLESGTTSIASTTDGKTLVTTCSESTMAGSVSSTGGANVIVSISSLTWGGCTVTTHTLKTGTLSISSSGTVSSAGTTITKHIGISCRYGTGTGTHLGTLKTGKLAINAILNEKEPKQFLCPDTIKWVASYTVTSPHDLTAGA